MDPLDNAGWYALSGPHKALAERHGPVLAYPRDVSPFVAVERLDDLAWESVASLSEQRDGVAALFRPGIGPLPPGLVEILRVPGLQMVARAALPEIAGPGVQRLGPADVPDMLALTQQTEPGPFLPRTIEMGAYYGVREGDQLIAMAGERLRLDGATELSALCTHSDARGRGLASYLTTCAARVIQARGDQCFLHVVEGNEAAIRIYERLGFSVRTRIEAVIVRRG